MRVLALAALVLAACGGAGAPGLSTGPGITSAPAASSSSSSGGSSSSTGSADDSAGSSSSTGLLHDVGSVMDFGPDQPVGCKGKVDLLFVISRQYTMKADQEQLLASLPSFVETIEEKLEGFDVHIMAANPDGKWPGWVCEKQKEGCMTNWPTCGDSAPGYQCKTFAEMMTPCDEQLGAGLIFNAGGGAANELCELYGGNRYIISGEPDMQSALECIAKVGWSGGDALVGDALLAALSPALNGPEGCNDGFLREDALLVVVLITDYHDDSKSYTKQQYEAILAAKKDPNAVVMLAIVPPLTTMWIPGCTVSLEEHEQYFDLLTKFPYHVFGDTCAPSYAPYFDEAVDKIGEACGSFIPQ